MHVIGGSGITTRDRFELISNQHTIYAALSICSLVPADDACRYFAHRNNGQHLLFLHCHYENGSEGICGAV